MPTAVRTITATKAAPRRRASSADPMESMHGVLTLAGDKGLLTRGRTQMIRGRMPEELVAQAKRKSGISSDSKLLEAALANLAVADDYADWLISQRETVDPALDLEF